MIIQRIYIIMRNGLSPGSKCLKCGASFGWKKAAFNVRVTKNSRIPIFCQDCNALATVHEREQALRMWKNDSILEIQSGKYLRHWMEEFKKEQIEELKQARLEDEETD